MKSRIVNERNQPIRVLHIVTIMNRGGLETMLMNYYRNIDRKKIQFDFVVHRSEKGAYDDEIMSLGGRILHVPPIQLKNILSYKKTLGAIFIDNPEYRIVHSHIDSLSALPLYIAKKTGVPIRIAHSHNSNFDTDSKKIIRNLAKRLIKYQATDIVGCSTDAIKFMFGNSAKDYRLISNAVDVTQFGFDQKIRIRIRKEFNYNDDDFIVGHVGRFEAQKNHDYLLEIFNEVFRLNNHAKLMLVGDGLLKKQIEAKAKELGISSKVIFTGNRTDVSYLMQAMDVFLMPSLYEGLPVVAIEAQISGLNCIFSDVVTKEICITENCTFIDIQSSAHKWAKSVRKTDPVDRGNVIEALIESDFNIMNAVNILIDFYLLRIHEYMGSEL